MKELGLHLQPGHLPSLTSISMSHPSLHIGLEQKHLGGKHKSSHLHFKQPSSSDTSLQLAALHGGT